MLLGENGKPLTSRQQTILQLLADGLLDKEIGERLGISRAGVKVHLSQARKRLGMRPWQCSRVQLARIVQASLL
jgi:DNA-binding NarL/FixJ family response regulator